MKTRLIILLVFVLITLMPYLHSQPLGKSAEIFELINEARETPQNFLAKHKVKISKYQPKFILLLEKATKIDKIIWDENLAENCRERVYGNLNPEYKGKNIFCGVSSGSGGGYFDREPLFFVCQNYTHVVDDAELYFGFYIDEKGNAQSWGASCDSKKYNYEFKGSVDSSKVDFKRIRTGSNENELNELDKEMIKEINFVRQYPQIYASIVADYLAKKSKSWIGLTKDEYEAGKELIEELKLMSPAQLLYPKHCIYEAAKKHGDDCKKRGFLDHIGSDGSGPSIRISSFCSDLLTGNENLVGGKKDARILVMQLLIDSGISSRGHRYNMLDPHWKYIGCYGYEVGNTCNYIQNFAAD
jgi:uncharacterized protein YkwD